MQHTDPMGDLLKNRLSRLESFAPHRKDLDFQIVAASVGMIEAKNKGHFGQQDGGVNKNKGPPKKTKHAEKSD